MPWAFNPFTGNLDALSDLSGYVPYTGATADVNLGSQDLTTTGTGTFGTGYIGNATDQLQQTFDSTDNSSPSYANLGGTGNRTTIITVTSTAIGSAYRPLFSLVDGVNPPLFFGCYWLDGSFIGDYVRFDFGEGSRKRITEVKLYQQSAAVGGTWQWQGSNDAVSWTNIGSTWTITTGTSQILGDISANAVGYRYYQMIGTAGAKGADPWIYEIEFKIDDYGVSSILQTYDGGVATGILSLQTEGGVARIAGLQIDQGGNIATPGKFLLGGLAVDDDTLVVDAVNHRVGISQSEPLYALHVNGTIATQSGDIIIGYNPSESQYALLDFSDSGNNSLVISTMYAGNGNLISFKPGTVEAFRVTRISSTRSDLQLVSDSNKISFGAGLDSNIGHTGTYWDFDIAQATAAVRFNPSGFNTDFQFTGDVGDILYLDAGLNSVACGYPTATGGTYSFSSGYDVQATGNYSAVFGFYSRSTGIDSFSSGLGAYALEEAAHAFGEYIDARSKGAIAGGYNDGGNHTDFYAGDGTGYGQVALGYASGDGGVISSITLNGAGTGYSASDVLTITGGTGGTATVDSANALGDNAITGVNSTPTYGGSGYTVNDVLNVISGMGNGSVIVTSVDTTGPISSLNGTPSNPGTGYTNGDTVTISAGNNDATVYISGVDGGGGVTSFYLTASGSGYSTGSGIGTSGGTGSGFQVQIDTVSASLAVTGISLNNGGSGYYVGTGFSTNAGTGSGCTVEITSVNAGGEITGLSLTTGGVGYVISNAVATTGGGGTGATVNITGASNLGRMVAEKTGSFVGGQDVLATTNPNIIAFGRSFTATTQDSFNIGFGQSDYEFTATAADFKDSSLTIGGTLQSGNHTIGVGAAATDYTLTFNGETNDGVITWMEDENWFKSNRQLRSATSLYRRYYHVPLTSANPGASGANWVSPNANTTGGWNLTNATHILNGESDIHADWDGASDPKFEVRFATNVDNTGGGTGDTVDLKMVMYYKGVGDTATKSQTVEVATVVGKSARYKQFKVVFPLNYDQVSNVLDVGDIVSFSLNLETDTSEVDDIILSDISFSYLTTHVGIEDGDE